MRYCEATELIFLFQGLSLPFIVLFAYLTFARQWKQSELIEKRGRASQVRAAFAPSAAGLPEFRPLNCPHCGSGLLLDSSGTLCPNCKQRGDLPKDYQRTAVLKSRVERLLASALRCWRLARLLTSRPVTWLLCALLLFVPLVMFPIVLVGSDKYHDTILDRWLAPYRHTPLPDLVAMISLVGGSAWWLGIAILASLGNEMRKKLPVFPVQTKELRDTATANCQSCGGAIQYQRGSFAAICGYCHVENYRARFARTENQRAEQQETQTQFLLFDALTIVNNYLFKIWILGAMILVVVALVGLSIGINSLIEK